MTLAKLFVLGQYPSAFANYDTGDETFKIYYRAGEARLALSGKFSSAQEAWADAARYVSAPRPPAAPLAVEVLDQR